MKRETKERTEHRERVDCQAAMEREDLEVSRDLMADLEKRGAVESRDNLGEMGSEALPARKETKARRDQ